MEDAAGESGQPLVRRSGGVSRRSRNRGVQSGRPSSDAAKTEGTAQTEGQSVIHLMTPSKCPHCGCKDVLKRDLLDRWPTGFGRMNELYWATCEGCKEKYRQRVIRGM